jgi:hypothetical protein
MSKIYPKTVIEKTELLIEGLFESNFFEEYEIDDLTFVRQHLNDLLTEKFIKGELEDDSPLFLDEEFEQLLKELVAGSVLYQLKLKGLVDSYEDDNTEEMFFLTEMGKKYIKGENTEN